MNEDTLSEILLAISCRRTQRPHVSSDDYIIDFEDIGNYTFRLEDKTIYISNEYRNITMFWYNNTRILIISIMKHWISHNRWNSTRAKVILSMFEGIDNIYTVSDVFKENELKDQTAVTLMHMYTTISSF